MDPAKLRGKGRVQAQGDRRPMAGHPEALRDLELILEARSQHYERADVTVDTTDKRVEVSLAELRMALAAYGVTKARVRGEVGVAGRGGPEA